MSSVPVTAAPPQPALVFDALMSYQQTAALRAANELCGVCNLFGYGEIKPLGSRHYESSMLNVFRRLEANNFQTVLIERKEDIWTSFKAFLAKDRAAES